MHFFKIMLLTIICGAQIFSGMIAADDGFTEVRTQRKPAGRSVSPRRPRHRSPVRPATAPAAIPVAKKIPTRIATFLAQSDEGLLRGGHVLEQHVTITDEELKKRFRSIQEVSSATKFESQDIAIAAIRKSIRQNADRINEWLENEDARPELSIYCFHDHAVGHGLTPTGGTSLGIVAGLRQSCVVLRKAKRSFIILTAYPIVPKGGATRPRHHTA